MLTDFTHKGFETCFPYFPLENQHGMSSPDFEVVCFESYEILEDLYRRKFKLKNKHSKKVKIITHYQYSSWPNFGSPNDDE